jgi:hypothetical protein
MSKNVWVQVSKEHEDLWENIEKLQAFRDGKQPSDVSDYQWKLLKKQLKAMRKYNHILALRVEDLYEGEILDIRAHTNADNAYTFIADKLLIDGKEVTGQSITKVGLNEDFKNALKSGYITINHETGEWFNMNRVLTPGQEPVKANVDTTNYQLQEDSNFMKDE